MKPTLAEDRGGADISGAVPHHHKPAPPKDNTVRDDLTKLENDMGIVVGDMFSVHKDIRDLQKAIADIRSDIEMLTKAVLPQP